MRQETTTVVARVTNIEGARGALDALARAGSSGNGSGAAGLFGDPALGIHFGRLLLVEGGSRFTSELLLESNFDTEDADEATASRKHLGRLAEKTQPALASVLRFCEGFRPSPRPADLAAFLTARVRPATARYQGHTNRSLSRIFLEQRVRETVMAYLETAPRMPPRDLYGRVREHVRARAREDAALAGLDLAAPAPGFPDPDVRSRALSHVVEPWIENAYLLAPVALRAPQIACWDLTDEPFDHQKWQEGWTEQDFASFRAVSDTEDHGIQNALSHVVPLRKGFDRVGLLRHVHAYIDRMAKQHFNDIGQLGGIPSIHFAQWMLLGEDRLLFLSNYDNSWESYLGDFVDQAAVGLNLAWASTELFPETHLLAFGGANDEERFKAWTRAYQIPTQLFYSAYPELGIAVINNNTWIRHGLHAAGPADLEAWFRRLS